MKLQLDLQTDMLISTEKEKLNNKLVLFMNLFVVLHIRSTRYDLHAYRSVKFNPDSIYFAGEKVRSQMQGTSCCNTSLGTPGSEISLT